MTTHETTTELATYEDEALTTENSHPVVADTSGRFGPIFPKDQDYKVVLKDSTDATIWTQDPVHGGLSGESVTARLSNEPGPPQGPPTTPRR